jgi:hypothetical protein
MKYPYQMEGSLTILSSFAEFKPMANEDTDQAQADQDPDATTTAPNDAVDPLDLGENTRSDEVSELEKYEQEREAVLAVVPDKVEEEVEQEQSADDDLTEDEKYDREHAKLDADEEPEKEEEQESEDEEEEPAAKVSDRFRFKSDEDKAVAALAKAKGCSLVEAARIYAGDNPTAKPTDDAEKQVDTQPKKTFG